MYPEIQSSQYATANALPLAQYVNNGIPDISLQGWKDFWTKTRDNLKNGHVILSWEEMFSYDPIVFFSAVKNEYANICIIVYLRRQDRFLESLWNQFIKVDVFLSDSFETFLQGKKMCNRLERLNSIAKIVGESNLIVRAYEKHQFMGIRKDVVSDFLCSLGIDVDLEKCDAVPRTNLSLKGNFIEIKRRMNKYLRKYPSVNKKIEALFLAYISHRNAKTLSLPQEADGILSSKERQKLLQYYAVENEEIAHKYLKHKDGILFYDKKPVPEYNLNVDTLCDDIESTFTSISTVFKQRLWMLKDIFEYKMNEQAQKMFFDEVHNVEELLIKIKNDADTIRSQPLDHRAIEEQCFELIEGYTQDLIHLAEEFDKVYEAVIDYLQTIQRDRKIVLFGIGGYCGYFLERLRTVSNSSNKNARKVSFDVTEQIFVDNNIEKQGQTFRGNKIYHSSEIQNWNDYLIIVTVCEFAHIAQIEQQLHGYGLKKDEDYILGTDLFPAPWISTVERS